MSDVVDIADPTSVQDCDKILTSLSKAMRANAIQADDPLVSLLIDMLLDARLELNASNV